jgi:mannose-6-phosphate isomerase class I
VHAIGAGILLAELQQPTDCTFRFWDWGSARALQPDDALAALDPAAVAEVWQPGSDPAILEGRHLRLHVGLHGATPIEPGVFSGPALVIATEGELDLCRGGDRVRVPRGEPRLVLADDAPFVIVPARDAALEPLLHSPDTSPARSRTGAAPDSQGHAPRDPETPPTFVVAGLRASSG